MQTREKVGKPRNAVFFQWFVAPESLKVGSLKRRVRSHLARWAMKKCTPLWCEAHFEVKTHHSRTTFGSWDVEKVHAVVARSTFSKSKCGKHTRFGPLLEVAMSKKCTPLWHEAHFEVKMYKTHQVRTTFGSCDVEKVHAVVVRSTFRSPGVQNTPVWTTFGHSDLVSRGRRKGLCTSSKVSKTWGFCSIFNYNHHYTTLHSNTLHYNYNYTFTTFHYTTLHYIPLRYTRLQSITLNYNQLRYTTYTTLHFTTLHSMTFNYTTLHTLHYTSLH